MILKRTNALKPILAGSAFMLLAAAPAQAAQRNFDRPPEKTIDLAGLDLDSEPGARAALRRIERAARDVCGGAHQVRELSERVKYRKCVETTTARTVRKLNAPRVTALYNKREENTRLANRDEEE